METPDWSAAGWQFNSDTRAGALGPEPLSREKEADIRELLHASHVLLHAGQLSEAVARQIMRAVKLARPEGMERVGALLRQEADQVFAANVPQFADAIVPLYNRYFTREEIRAMVAFYGSDLGKKTLDVMPRLLKESAGVTERWARELIPQIYRRVRTQLRAEGFEL